ncbi:ComEC/Rec2-related protein [Metamycoplasma arthritidis]|nr:ComEC/Rec2 family competence protein [Metamycoplasma arthritidis]VEU78765.1 ComEC/Rec2-related protein [Metamycoplasma arthritidis]
MALTMMASYLLFWAIVTSLNNIEIDQSFKIIRRYRNSFIVNYNGINIIVKNSNTLYQVNDIIQLKGKLKMISNISNFNLSNNTFLELIDYDIKRIFNDSSWLENYLASRYEPANKFLLLLLLSRRVDLTASLLESAKELNIAHLFVISGLHFGLFYLTFLWILKKCKVNVDIANLISVVILFAYLFLLDFQISALRAFTFIVAKLINDKLLDKKFNSLDILVFVALLFMIVNPNIIYNYSFILSFTITFVILLIVQATNKFKSEWIKNVLVLLGAYLSSLLISLTFNQKIVTLGFIYQIFFSPIIIFSYFFSMLFFWTSYLLPFYFKILNSLIQIIKTTSVVLEVPKKLYYLPLILHLLFFILSSSRISKVLTFSKAIWFKKLKVR